MDKGTVGITILIGVLWLFILFVYIESIRSFRNKDDNRFNENLYQYRKTLYFLFVSLLGGLWICKVFTITDWRLILALVAIVIFIDIFVFSTPTITKIWKTEFQAYDPLKTYIQENSFIEEKQRDKLNYFSQLVQIAPYIKSEIELQHNDFLEGLGAFLNYYAEGFGLCIHLYNVETVADQSEGERMNEFLDTIHRIKQTHTLDWLCMLDNLDVQGDSDAEEVVIDNLWSGEIVALDREEKHGKGMSHLCPIFVGDDYIFILFIEEIYQRIYEIDALFITNLAFLYCYLETQN